MESECVQKKGIDQQGCEAVSLVGSFKAVRGR